MFMTFFFFFFVNFQDFIPWGLLQSFPSNQVVTLYLVKSVGHRKKYQGWTALQKWTLGFNVTKTQGKPACFVSVIIVPGVQTLRAGVQTQRAGVEACVAGHSELLSAPFPRPGTDAGPCRSSLECLPLTASRWHLHPMSPPDCMFLR